MAVATHVKDPSAKLDYALNWTTYLTDPESGALADTISSATWTVPAGLTKVSESNTTTTTTVRISGGTAGTSYEITCHIVLASGQEDERSIAIAVQEL